MFTASSTLMWAVLTGPTDWVCHIGTITLCVEAVAYSCIIRPRRCRSAAAYSHQTFPWTICRSLGLSVSLSVQCIVENGESDPDAVSHRRSDGFRDEADSVVWGSVHGNGYFWGRIWGRHCNQWGLYGVNVRQLRDAALFPNYFGQTCCNMVDWFWWDSSLMSTTNWFLSVLWHCWFGHLACKNRPQNDVLCVEWDTKPIH